MEVKILLVFAVLYLLASVLSGSSFLSRSPAMHYEPSQTYDAVLVVCTSGLGHFKNWSQRHTSPVHSLLTNEPGTVSLE